MKKLAIGVVGSGEGSLDLNAKAEEVGALIARAGFALVNGGLGGVMEASAKGCKESGGLTIGLLPGADASVANPYIDIAIPTGMGEMRNALIVRAAEGIIAIGGSMGTLSEIALALKTAKPVVGLSTWEVSDDMVRSESPEDAFRELLKLTGRSKV